MKKIIKIGEIPKKFKLMSISISTKEKEDSQKCKNQEEVFSAAWCVVAQEEVKTHYQEEAKCKRSNKTTRKYKNKLTEEIL